MTDTGIDLSFLRSCLMGAGKMALGQRGQMVSMVKADHTPVTEVDHQVEKYLIEQINQRYPDHTILSEESGLHANKETCKWVIDPIDGTRSFATGLPIWGVSIGVLQGNEPVAGGFYMPVTNEMYWGTRQQAFYNDQPLAPVQAVDLNSPLVFLAIPSSAHLHFTIRYPRVRALGSTAAHLAYTITGAAVGALTRSIYLWDIAGMLPLLAATGIAVITLSGKPYDILSMMNGEKAPEPLLAAHPGVAERLRTTIQTKEREPL
jgi:myo-inositol-1(or 4)-monophosphatase